MDLKVFNTWLEKQLFYATHKSEKTLLLRYEKDVK